MMRLPNPWMILGAITAASLVYFYAHHVGYVKRDQEMQLEIARLNGEAREKEQKLSQDLNNTSSQLKEANDVVTKKQTDLDAAIRSGRMRLNTSCVPASTGSTTASGDNSKASESERETLLLIAQLAAEGDRAINELNACIAAYNQVRDTINGQR
jgi:3-polyprenyl-4-hydroxybenzoate decarboxylase